ncbi:DNA primase/helicase [Vibrio phage BUCT006]|nr:DNA primase/helicase [Vibrio phage BUCT006]
MPSHDKETVLRAAEGLHVSILTSLTDLPESTFDHRKEHPCPLCGGKTRFRYRKEALHKIDAPFFCNVCGSKDFLNFFIAVTGYDFPTAINTIGDYLNCVPVEQIRVANQQAQITASFPTWYKFDMDKYKQIKDGATVGISPWQRVSGLNVLDILKHGDNALIPLLNEHGKAVDFTMIDIDGNWQTTGGNKSVPSGFYSTFGDTKGKHAYIAVSPFHSAHASIFMQRQVICCYDVANIWDVAKNLEDAPVIVTASMDDVLEADSLNFKQLTFNSKNNCVNRRLFEVGEIVKLKQEQENGK